MWDSLRPIVSDQNNCQTDQEMTTMWLSFSKVRKIAKDFSFLMVIASHEGGDSKTVELTNENKHLLEEDTKLFLIEKPLVEFKLAIENKKQIPI